eukprot:4809672-Prymnesium_polylepis.1
MIFGCYDSSQLIPIDGYAWFCFIPTSQTSTTPRPTPRAPVRAVASAQWVFNLMWVERKPQGGGGRGDPGAATPSRKSAPGDGGPQG